jgi:hypothetical protein
MKKCSTCRIIKEDSEFYKDKTMKNGLHPKCKSCSKLLREKYRISGKIKEWDSKYNNSIKGNTARSIYKKKWYSENLNRIHDYNNSPYMKKKKYNYTKQYRIKNKEKFRAYNILGEAVRSGRINKQNSCSVCKISGVVIEAHHYDYSKPLDVVWVCNKCHKNIHKLEKIVETGSTRTQPMPLTA